MTCMRCVYVQSLDSKLFNEYVNKYLKSSTPKLTSSEDSYPYKRPLAKYRPSIPTYFENDKAKCLPPITQFPKPVPKFNASFGVPRPVDNKIDSTSKPLRSIQSIKSSGWNPKQC